MTEQIINYTTKNSFKKCTREAKDIDAYYKKTAQTKLIKSL